jgi:hypothetical protein
MRDKIRIFTVLLALGLFAAACAGQQATNEPAEGAAVPTASTEENTATEEAGEATAAPTAAPEEGTATEEATEAAAEPTGAADAATSPPNAGGTAGIPQTGSGDAGVPDDLPELVRALRATGASVEGGAAVQLDAVSAPGQSLIINGEEVLFFTYATAEELEIEASALAREQDPESEPKYYKLANMLVLYAGRNPGVRDLLEDVLGAQAAGQ